MHMLTERLQVLVSSTQRKRLEQLSAERGLSVGGLIRQAIDVHIGSAGRTPSAALGALLALDAPVDDWDVMKAEIEAGAAR
jgi:hypothetical protein